MFADVILPLALPKLYTYQIPDGMKVEPGMRVVVQFGKRRKYAAIIKRIHDEPPAAYAVKPVLSKLDEYPVVWPHQLHFWEWIARYYACTEGEVMNVAIPAHLKLSSETIIQLDPAYADETSIAVLASQLTDEAFQIVEALAVRHELSLAEVQQLLGETSYTSAQAVVKSLIDQHICVAYESIRESYRPRLETYILLSPAYAEEQALHQLFDQLEKAPRQLQILMKFYELREKQGWVRKKDLLEQAEASHAQLKALVDKGIFQEIKQTVDRIAFTYDGAIQQLHLTPSQQTCVQQIHDWFKEKRVVLLHGVTSSGKTLIYVSLILEAIAKGEQVLYLLPEIALTAQMIRRLQQYLGNQVGVYHSRLSHNERVEMWNKVREGSLQVIVGSRSALWLPFCRLSLIIVDEEHDMSFKQQDPAPRYHARDAAIYYAHLLHARVILGSATPAVETYQQAMQGKYGYVMLKERYGQIALPDMILADMRTIPRQHRGERHITPLLEDHIRRTLQQHKQVILFQNRRGYAPSQICQVCGWVPHCEQCDVALTYHKSIHQLVCHYCGRKYPPVTQCQACGSHAIIHKSFGTERIEDELHTLFPKASIARMDLDTMRKKDSYHQLIHRFEQGRIDILVGTQMVVKGLDFDSVGLVGILLADSLLNYPDFRVNERAFQLMEQVSGRAGRKGEKGMVVIQAYQLRHPVLAHVMAHDYAAFFQMEIEARAHFQYPPFTRLMKIVLKHAQQEKVVEAAHLLAGELTDKFPGQITGPAAPLVSRIRNEYLQEILIRLPRSAHKLQEQKDTIVDICNQLQQQSSFRHVRMIVDVDPMG
ncbi:replication restart DNA helicase PriA [Thermoflavifilum aggregans]|uniref:Replication restart protein PriA n=1 Tax=Thermoflavifilum aggregans TaxID=454188 RepID=A0A2M9CW52_9BACT|nr:primosomal protein N' [Thermoflavifilum aggregans]PJJ76107.1 replication restart DNA helicase PriA [Thermoflavifilum aggregans]